MGLRRSIVAIAVLIVLGAILAIALNVIASFSTASVQLQILLGVLSTAAALCVLAISEYLGRTNRKSQSRERLALQSISRLQSIPARPSQEIRIPLRLKIEFTGGRDNEERRQLQEVISDNSLSDLLRRTRAGAAVAIVGGPGTGKTSLLFSLSEQLAEAALQDDRLPVPVYISLTRLSCKSTLEQGLAEATQLKRETLTRWLTEGQLIVLLDGFDELAPEHADDVAQQYKQLRSSYRHLSTVFTSRPEYFQQLSQVLAPTLTAFIQPPSMQQIQDFLSRLAETQLLTQDEKERLLRILQSRPTALNLARSPLALQLLVAASQRDVGSESIESRVTFDLLSRALYNADSDNAWLAYRELLQHGSQPQVAQAAEALSTYFSKNGDVQSAERAYALASERFEIDTDAVVATGELSQEEQRALGVLRPNVTYDLAQITSATSLSPSATLEALDSLKRKGFVLQISADPEGRYSAISEKSIQA